MLNVLIVFKDKILPMILKLCILHLSLLYRRITLEILQCCFALARWRLHKIPVSPNTVSRQNDILEFTWVLLKAHLINCARRIVGAPCTMVAYRTFRLIVKLNWDLRRLNRCVLFSEMGVYLDHITSRRGPCLPLLHNTSLFLLHLVDEKTIIDDRALSLGNMVIDLHVKLLKLLVQVWHQWVDLITTSLFWLQMTLPLCWHLLQWNTLTRESLMSYLLIWLGSQLTVLEGAWRSWAIRWRAWKIINNSVSWWWVVGKSWFTLLIIFHNRACSTIKQKII